MDKKLKILIVEDDDIARIMQMNIVQACNCEADSVSNATQALDQLAKISYDLILMDISLPDRDGMELTKKIRATEGANQKTPIVALTIHQDKEYKQMADSFAMDSYVIKPLTKEKFLEALKLCN